MICIAVLVALGAPGVAQHFRNAAAVGLTQEALKEIILQVTPYAGLPKTLQAMALFKRVQRGEPTAL